MIFRAAASGVAAFALTAICAPAVIWASARLSLYDPAGALKIHTRPTSRLGGIAIIAGLAGSQVLAGSPALFSAVPLAAAVAILFIAGLVDDLQNLSPYIRLGAQFLAAGLVAMAGWHLPLVWDRALNFGATTFFLVTFTNGFNFFDGADGLTVGTAGIAACGFALLPGISGQKVPDGTLAWAGAIAGASLAFLFFNFPGRAKIFLGDSGSTVLGFSLALLALEPPGAPSPVHGRLFFLLFAASLPLLDLGFSVIRRMCAGRSPFFGDRSHLCDLLLRRGWSSRRVALSCYAATAALVVFGWRMSRASTADFAIVSLLLGCVFLWVGGRLGALRISENDPQRTTTGMTYASGEKQASI